MTRKKAQARQIESRRQEIIAEHGDDMIRLVDTMLNAAISQNTVADEAARVWRLLSLGYARSVYHYGMFQIIKHYEDVK